MGVRVSLADVEEVRPIAVAASEDNDEKEKHEDLDQDLEMTN